MKKIVEPCHDHIVGHAVILSPVGSFIHIELTCMPYPNSELGDQYFFQTPVGRSPVASDPAEAIKKMNSIAKEHGWRFFLEPLGTL